MKIELENVKPRDIERRSFEIITEELGDRKLDPDKELIMKADVPYIVARGRKGGSNIAACICNALLYMIDDRRD